MSRAIRRKAEGAAVLAAKLRRKAEGAAVLAAMLVVAIAASLAAQVFERHQLAVRTIETAWMPLRFDGSSEQQAIGRGLCFVWMHEPRPSTI